jgi:DegV family protein with EDD domain
MYRRLPDQKVIPQTSAPSVGTYIETYEKLAETHDEIISVHLSSKLSLTHNSAVNAVAELGPNGPRIEVLDSLQASMALGYSAIRAAEAIADGSSLDETVAMTKSTIERAEAIFMVDTLDYLVRGGRIGKAKGFVGSILKVRPILAIQDGIAHPLERARNRKKGITRLKALVAERAPLEKLSVLYTTDKDDAEAIAAEVASYVPNGELHVAQLGPVVGNYVGPGLLGACLVRAESS